MFGAGIFICFMFLIYMMFSSNDHTNEMRVEAIKEICKTCPKCGHKFETDLEKELEEKD